MTGSKQTTKLLGETYHHHEHRYCPVNIMSQKHAFWGLSWALAIKPECQRATVVISLSIRIEDSRKPVGNKNLSFLQD